MGTDSVRRRFLGESQEVVAMGERTGYRCDGQWTDTEWPFAQNLFFAD